MPKVSVIVPIYCVEQYIEKCVRTLFSQTLTDIEYIFVDDCSPDLSINILKSLIREFSLKLERENKVVKLFTMSENSGQAAVRKFAVQHATGDFIIHCDSDDWVEADMYQAMYDEAVNSSTDIVICDFYQSSRNGEKYIKSCNNSDSKKKLIYDFMTGRGYWSLCNKLVRRSLYDDQLIRYPEGNMGEDMVIILQLIHYARKVSYIEKGYYHYYVNPSSIVRDNSEENILRKFTQVVENVRIIEVFLKHKYSGILYNFSLDSLKYRQLNILNPLKGDERINNLWRNTFSDIKYRIWLNPYIRWQNKVKFYMRILNLFN